MNGSRDGQCSIVVADVRLKVKEIYSFEIGIMDVVNLFNCVCVCLRNENYFLRLNGAEEGN